MEERLQKLLDEGYLNEVQENIINYLIPKIKYWEENYELDYDADFIEFDNEVNALYKNIDS